MWRKLWRTVFGPIPSSVFNRPKPRPNACPSLPSCPVGRVGEHSLRTSLPPFFHQIKQTPLNQERVNRRQPFPGFGCRQPAVRVFPDIKAGNVADLLDILRAKTADFLQPHAGMESNQRNPVFRRFPVGLRSPPIRCEQLREVFLRPCIPLFL